MILIGSRALAFRAPGLLKRQPRDFDFIASKSEALDFVTRYQLKISETEDVSGKIIVRDEPPCEFELTDRPSSQVLTELVSTDPTTIKTSFGLVPNFNLLFTLKTSHRYLKDSPFFWKTAQDYHLLKRAGAKVLPEYQDFLKLREKETYTYNHPKLNTNKVNFFSGDQVTYIYQHDTIHEAMKHLDQPAYEYYKKDGEEVNCDKSKFFSVSEEIRLYGVLEETYVLALERSQIPHRGKLSPRQSFMMALSKVCSSITSGWFREYAYENIFKIVKMYDENYLNKFDQAVKNGVVKAL